MKTLTGKVVSDKMNQTVVVEVERFVTHPLYNKRVRRTKKYHADNQISAKKGDVIKMTECAPISKTKMFKVIEIVKNNDTA